MKTINFERKLKFTAAAVLATSCLSFTSCIDIFNIMLEDHSDEYEKGKEIIYNNPVYDEPLYTSTENEYFRILDSSSITLNNVKGKSIYYINFNTTKPVDDSEYNNQRTLDNSKLRYLVSSSGLTRSNSVYVARSANTDENAAASDSTSNIRHFTPKLDFDFTVRNGSDPSDCVRSVQSSTPTDYLIGDTKKIFVDTDSDISVFRLKDATLQAKNDVCYVWVVDDYYTRYGSPSGSKVNRTIAENVAEKFAKYYSFERELFGNEGEYLLSSEGYRSHKEMKEESDTSNKINIVIYDIGNDYSSGNTSGVVGYFYSKDYFKKNPYASNITSKSNEGKYFYLDAPFCNYNPSNTSNPYSGTGDVSETAITTLYHEFQHMINFNTKEMENIHSPVWYNEMLSMLAEDMLSRTLNLSDSEAPWGTRFPTFNNLYFISGIDEYRQESKDPTGLAVCSYSSAYTFGAWLARQFGGVNLVREMSTNKYAGMDSIRCAIHEVTGKNYTSQELYEMFIQAVVFEGRFAESKNLPTLYQDGSSTYTHNDLTAEMPALNLYDLEFKYDGQYVDKIGPELFGTSSYSYPRSYDYFSSAFNTNIRPHGFIVHYAGKAIDSTVTLNFSQKNHSAEKVYILVQDEISNLCD